MRKLIDQALLIRETEEQLFGLFAAGKLHGTIHSCVGQEFSAACVSAHLNPTDMVFSNHRGHGHFLAFSGDLRGLIHELRGEPTGVCGGVGGSQHLRAGNFIANGVQGNLVPAAAGAALAQKREGKNISVVWIGDGTLGQGVLYETLNIASLLNLPILFVLEDNGYAQSTLSQQVFAGDLKTRVEGFGVDYHKFATSDWKSLYLESGKIIGDMRTKSAPHFLHISTARLRPHSKGDDTRSPEEIKRLWEADPLSQIIAEQSVEVQNSLAKVKQAVASVLAEEASRKYAVKAKAAPSSGLRSWSAANGDSDPQSSYRASLNKALHLLLERDNKVLFLGQDIRDPYGGCFKVSAGLSARFSDRVLNWPISEAALAGFGVGWALRGHFCLVEFMFGDFTLLAMDQIVNGAAKLHGLDSHKDLKVVFRTPMGGGRGYGPTHSQNLEKHFLGTPGLEVFALNCFVPPADFYLFLHSDLNSPALVIENKTLYAQVPQVPERFPKWKLERDGTTFDYCLMPADTQAKVLLVSYGGYCHDVWIAAQRLLEEFGIACGCLFLTKLSSYSASLDSELFNSCDSVLIFEEGVGYAGMGAELMAQLKGFPGQVKRWSPPEKIIPAAPALEKEFRLSPELVIAEVLEVLS